MNSQRKSLIEQKQRFQRKKNKAYNRHISQTPTIATKCNGCSKRTFRHRDDVAARDEPPCAPSTRASVQVVGGIIGEDELDYVVPAAVLVGEHHVPSSTSRVHCTPSRRHECGGSGQDGTTHKGGFVSVDNGQRLFDAKKMKKINASRLETILLQVGG